MASIAEISRDHTALSQEAVSHLQRLVTSWGLLADFCFADLLLFATADRATATDDGPDAAAPFVVLGHIRPTTSQTLYRDDLIGRIVPSADRPLVARAFQHGEIIEGEVVHAAIHERVRVQCIPVRCNGEVVGIMTRESAPLVGRQPGELERTYVEIFHRLARMIANGDYPYVSEETDAEEPPRVGDGVILLDRSARVVFSSPNAISALHRIGIHGNTEGMKLTDYGFDERIVVPAYQSRVPVTREIERGIDTTVVFRCLPLLDATDVSGAVLVCRDISDLRRRDRLLLSKDATIREIHHRVKNNLQTIGSLLRLQGRRLESPEARSAVEESVRRIRSIAIVHESLSRNAEDDVPFGDILRPIVRMAEESLVSPECPVYFRLDGEAGRLPATVATPLAVVLNELLQNAVDHAYPPESNLPGGHVKISLTREDQRLCVEVADDGIGMPSTFDLGTESGLGLTIVRTLVETELGGEIAVRANRPGTPRPGTVVELSVQLDAPWLSGDDETVRRPTGQMPAIRVGEPPPSTTSSSTTPPAPAAS